MAIDKKQNVVIVGGGSAGAAIVKRIVPHLSPSAHNLTLITSRPFFINPPAILRMAVTAEGTLEEQALMPYAHGLVAPGFEATLKIGKVARFTSSEGGQVGGEVILEGGEIIPYSILVLATGNSWTGPMNVPDANFTGTQAYLNTWRHKFSKAKDVVLIGGGVIGMELAGEIKDFHPGTRVTVVHRDTDLLNSAYPKRFRAAALRRLKQTGARVILDDSLYALEPSADGTVTTAKGEVIKADLVIPCLGGRPNTSFISASLGPHILTNSGHVKIKPTFQVQGYPRIFAAGDIIDWDEQKQAAKAYLNHSPLVTSNILAILNGSTPLKLYKGSNELVVIVTGRSGGVAYVELFCGFGIILGNFIVRHLKSQGLIIEAIRGWYSLGNFSSQDKVFTKA